ncbi:MAG: nucleotidyl transferase AbiEii/AbiGii toxin family protein [Ferrimicrobium sp.]
MDVTAFAPLSPVDELPLRTIIDRVAGIDIPPDAPTMPVVSLADTLADKLVRYLRRNAQERDHETRGEYDGRLVRHIHDTHAVLSHLQAIDSFDMVMFYDEVKGLVATVLERDALTYGRQHEAFARDPHAILSAELDHVGDDATRTRYDQFCSSMIWGLPPSFDDAVASLVDLASYCLDVPTPTVGVSVPSPSF